MLLQLAFITAAALDSAAVQGVWRTEGYGLVVAIAGNEFKAYEETGISCLPSLTASLRPGGKTGTVEFGNSDGLIFVVSNETRDRVRIHFEGAASDMFARRAAELPGACGKPVEDTPLRNFDIFAQTYAAHYILFGQKKVDWPAVVAAARAKVTPKTTRADLFVILQGMIEPLHDAHTFLIDPRTKTRFGAARPGTDSLLKGGVANLLKNEVPKAFAATAKYLKGPLHSWCNDQVWSGKIDEGTAYLRLLSFSGYAKTGGFREELAALEMALDSLLVPGLKRLIVDVRINMGGADPLGLAIARRLATVPYVAYSKEARSDPANPEAWTPGQASRVTPTTKRSFKGPVAILTSGLTISAGETFTQAMMGRRPAVFRVGESTQGVFSDVLGRQLPNGFRFGLPNEVFRAPDGRTFDGPGIPPTHPVPVFSSADRALGKDSALEKALELTKP